MNSAIRFASVFALAILSHVALGQSPTELVVQSCQGNVQQFSARPDGSLVAAAGEAGIQLWTHEGRLLRTISHATRVSCLALNPRFDLVVAKDKILDLSGATVAELKVPGGNGQLYRWSPDGEVLAVGTVDRTLLYSRDGRALASCARYSSSFDFSPSSDALIATHLRPSNRAGSASVGVWNMQGELLREIVVGDKGLEGVAVAADGSRFLLRHTRYGQDTPEGPLVTLWTIEGEHLKDLRLGNGDPGPIFATQDGGFLTSDVGGMLFWSREGEERGRLQGVVVEAVMDESLVGRRYQESGESVWKETHYEFFDLEGRVSQQLRPESPSIRALAASPTEGVLATLNEAGVVRVWRWTGEEIATFVPATSDGAPLLAGNLDFQPLAFSADGQSLIMRTREERYRSYLRRYSLTGKLLQKLHPQYEGTQSKILSEWVGLGRTVRGLSSPVMPDGRRILRMNSRLETQPIDQPKARQTELVTDNMSGATEILYSGDNKLLYVLRRSNLEIRDPMTGVLRSTTALEGDPKNLVASPTGKHLAALGGTRAEGAVCILNKEGVQVALGRHPSATSLVGLRGPVFTHDGRGVITAASNGTVRLWLWESDQAITWLHEGNQWIMYTDDGLFDGSRDGGQFLGMTKGSEAFTVDQFALVNNRPDLILERMGVGGALIEVGGAAAEAGEGRGLEVRARDPRSASGRSLIQHFREQFERRLRRAGLTEADLSKELHAPEVSMGSVAATDGVANITVTATDSLRSLKRLHAWVNGVPVEEFDVEGQQFEGVVSLPLNSGRNLIEVGVVNDQGVESLRALTTVVQGSVAKSNLHVIAIGVSDYRDDDLDLTYAHKDAQDLVQTLKANGGSKPGQVFTHLLVNEQATREGVLALKEIVQQIDIEDTLVLFVAGHGLHDEDPASTWYYLTHETELDNLAGSAVTFDALQELLSECPARKKLFLMDTCESGELESEANAVASLPAGMNARTSKKLVQRAGASEGKSLVRGIDRDRYIYYDLLRRSGAIVFSSSRGSEFSYEDASIENGWFTEQLILALTTDQADENRDHWVDSSELRRFVSPRVAERTGGRQNPTVDRDNVHQVVLLPLK